MLYVIYHIQSFISARNCKSFLVRSKVSSLDRTVGSSKCGSKRCQVVLMFQKQINRQYKINHQLNFNDKCLTYLFSCQTCGLHSTTDRFRPRWNDYKDSDKKANRGEQHMQQELLEHFHLEKHNGFLQDYSITMIDKTNGSGPTRGEQYCHIVLKTVAPYGLNRIE